MTKFLISFFILFYALGCENNSTIGPADIRFGQDTCSACSMIISEKQHAAQYLLANGEVRKFDDTGCMIEHIKNTEKQEIKAVFVKDFSTNNWINAGTARFIKSDKIITPMGHGIVAISNDKDPVKVQEEYEGKSLGSLDDIINTDH